MEERRSRNTASRFEPWTLRSAGGVTFLEYSEWPDVRCLYTTRIGGVSGTPYNTLNLSHDVGDSREAVEENLSRLCSAAGIRKQAVVRADQVHSNGVNVVASPVEGLRGDALVTRTRGIWLAVSVADCVPVYVCDTGKGAVGIAHAGWRGTLAGVVAACVKEMRREFGSNPAEMAAILGPGIGSCCFQVAADVAEQFEKPYPGSTSETHVDLFEANRVALEELGVSCVSSRTICTSCNEDLFFSHRRDGGVTGRMLALISRT
jgi:YfiH family protein